MKNLAKAVLAVMEDVKGVDKSMTVGTGNASYKGVSDKDVKTAIGRSMQKHGLTLLPIGVEDSVQVDRWEETSQYGVKQKQNINVSVKTKYLLLHESGESQEVMGYGHGIDPQDKAAGKATTYALKNLLLYMFLVPTGTIDDTDNTHSDSIPTPPSQTPAQPRVTDHNALALLNTCITLDELGRAWKTLNAHEQRIPSVIALKESLKAKFTQP
jgi:hypothetical protein